MANSVEMKRLPFRNRRPPTALSMSARKLAAKPIERPEGMWQRIAQKAYELYEQRGMTDIRSGIGSRRKLWSW